jgi:uncharacterized protein (DUF927 family)
MSTDFNRQADAWRTSAPPTGADANGKGSPQADPASPAFDQPPLSREEQARAVLSVYHALAADAGLDGIFVLTIVDSKTEKAYAQRFAIGDVDAMATEAVARGSGGNVYFAPAILRKDLPAGKRGTKKDIIAVLGLAIDDDGDTGDVNKRATRPTGIVPSLEVTSCTKPATNLQPHFIFTRPLPPDEAERLAKLLYQKCGGDYGTKDIAHVWRVPGTFNYPNAAKRKRGRPAEPQPVRITTAFSKLIDPAELRRALESMPDRKVAKARKAKANGARDYSGGSRDRDAILARLPGYVIDLVETEGEGDRSAHCFRTMMALMEYGLTDDEIRLLADGGPFAVKFTVRGDIDAEIARVRSKWEEEGSKLNAKGKRRRRESGNGTNTTTPPPCDQPGTSLTLYEGPPDDDPRSAGLTPEPFECQGRFLLVRGWNEDLPPGVYFNEAEDVDEDGEPPRPEWHRICSPIEPLAKSRDHENRNWGRILEVTDSDGVRHVWAMPARIGPTVGDGVDFRRELVGLGLEIISGTRARNRLNDYVTMWRPSRMVRCVGRVGWCSDACDAFIMPDQQFGGDEEIVLQMEGVAPEFATSGTLDQWRREVAARCLSNTRLVFAVSAAFAGPLLRLAGEESGGVHFAGPSSIGKTTMLHAARSVWGMPLGSWRTTDNNAEAMAAGACDTLLTLDEISQAHPRVVGDLAYMLGNERGKGRMNRNITARQPHRWRILFLSTGEVGMATRLLEGGAKARAGQEVRVLEVPADAGQGMGVFENLCGFGSAAELAEQLRLAADRCRGRAAREFLSCLTKNMREAMRSIQERAEFISENCPADADGQVRRACGRFAVIAIAGELATMFGITGWAAGEAKAATIRCWRDWLVERGGTGAAEVRDALVQARLFFEQHGESRFSLAWDPEKERPVSNRAGFRKAADTGATYYVLPEVFRCEVCKGFDYKMVAREMEQRGWLLTQRPDLQRKERIPGEGLQRVYVIPPAFLCADIDNSLGTARDDRDSQ